VISYNPGYQSLMKDLKQSTKQRFGGLDFTYPEHDIETEIVAHESGVDAEIAGKLVSIAERAATSRATASTRACRPAC
jgi:nitric oxide reductase NorQ protein